ncbi:FTR1 family iron permease [Bifidobacterium castoris]|uniref:Iron permease n=1 Tax=Bifidobacterium castoris TaxID=2306972 RepID=A0A430F6B0_9BIFI|nr:FTR1 family protein [Bifidobacterium castoris]RSX46801.1 iron permease [Bifidobacterium castoris]
MQQTVKTAYARWAAVLAGVALAAVALCSGIVSATPAAANDASGAAAIAEGASDASAAQSAADYDSWNAVAEAIVAELDAGLEDYDAGNRSGAASHFSRALNTGYVASNFAKATADRLGQDAYTAQLKTLRELGTLAYRPDAAAQIEVQAQRIAEDVRTSAARLDADAALLSPRDFAAARTQKTQEEREELDANKVHVNEGRGERSWSQVAAEMATILDEAQRLAAAGDGKAGAAKVNDAYYQYYEKLGFEKNVMNAIGGSRVSKVESTFKETRKAMIAGRDAAGLVTELKTMLVEDGTALDGGAGGSKNAMTAFVTSAGGQSFLVLIREGLEALLVVAAVIAYLLRAGMRRFVRWVYAGAVLGLVGSGAVAIVLMRLFGGSGPQQEIMEGVCALVAAVMLVWSGNWMFSKRSADSWNRYIREKTESAVGSVRTAPSVDSAAGKAAMSLAMLSFLAVFREGAETVIFYESIHAMTQDGRGMWTGGLAAAAVLAVLFVVIRLTSVRIPVGPFFIVTSVLMSALAVVFAGGGVHSLIEGDLIAGTYLEGFPTNDWLGVYPYVQTLVAQAVAAIIVIGMFMIGAFTQRAHDGARKAAATPDADASATVGALPEGAE